MEKISVKIDSEYIKLGELLKYANIVSQGSEAKYLIKEGNVKVNGETVLERGKKIYPGSEVFALYNKEEFLIKTE